MWKHIPTISPTVVIFQKNNTNDHNHFNFSSIHGHTCNIYDNDRSTDKMSFEKFVGQLKFTQSTVGSGRGNKIIDTVRKSTESSCQLLTEYNGCIHELFKQSEFLNMFPSYYHNFMEIPYALYGKMLKYDVDDFFAKHTDGKASDNHFQTIVVLPPKEINQFEGGELIFYTDEGEIFINNEMLINWLFIIFRTTVPHECKPVTNGVRYSFAFKYEMKSEVIELFRDYHTPITLNVEKQPMNQFKLKEIEESEGKLTSVTSEIDELEEKLFQLRKRKQSFENKLVELRTDVSLMNERKPFEFDTQQGFVILRKYYDSIKSPEELIGNHRILYNSLIKKYGTVHVRNYLRNASLGEVDEKYEDDELILPSNSAILES